MNILEKRAIAKARRVAVQKLIGQGLDPVTAENHVAAVLDDEVESFIQTSKMKFGSVGSGGVLQWITDHMPQILEIVKFFMSIVAMFGTKTGNSEDDSEES